MILGLSIRRWLGETTHAPIDGNNKFLETKIPMNPLLSERNGIVEREPWPSAIDFKGCQRAK